ncbi:FCD domain-containing protein [Streptomyces sp. NPDC052225]|uniref:FadR/GntR family transcriptional regulator n=1 Tax=Streptomyces sp. NPDC052225 TaxID=3154949 RepID=UPI00341E98E8
MTSSPPVPHARAGRDAHRTAVEVLARGIADGTYAIGTQLQLAVLTAQLGAAEPVIGGALHALASKGLVTTAGVVRPQPEWNLLDSDVLRWLLTSGATPWPDGFISDLHELRRAVEPSAAALAAQHRSADDLSALDQALTVMAAAQQTPDPDPALAARADAAFHTTLLAASGNRFFAHLARVIIPALTARNRKVHAGPHHSPLPAHTEVAACVRERDADGAYTAMLELLDVSQRDDP